MTATNFPAALAFVWQRGYDTPDDGYHVTPGDTGGGTYGGVIEETWDGAVGRGLVSGSLATATRDQLATVLRDEFWGADCDTLPPGLDFILFNGRMMSGGYPKLFQTAVGAVADGDIGPATLAAAQRANAATVIEALTVAHIFYLSQLPSWGEFHGGWIKRIVNAHVTANGLLPAQKGTT